MKTPFFLIALFGILTCGCQTTFPHENLALKRALGADLDEPLGGELALDKFGLSGASFVTEWIEPEDMPLLKGRGYTYPGEGVFDGKTSWSVEEWANRRTGRIELFVARQDFSEGRLRKTPGSESVRQNGERIRQYFTVLMGPESASRCRDQMGNMIPRPASGAYEQNYLWVRGKQAIRLGLAYADGRNGSDGTITLEVQRLDALDPAVREKVLSAWGLKCDSF